MKSKRYGFNICMVHDSVTCLGSVRDYQDIGWETVSVFTDNNGILSILLRKDFELMTEQEKIIHARGCMEKD
jgi:hypothetical protein